MPPTRTTDCWSLAIAARTATRKRIGCCWRRYFRGRPPSRRRRESRRPSVLGGRRRHCSVFIAPAGALVALVPALKPKSAYADGFYDFTPLSSPDAGPQRGFTPLRKSLTAASLRS